MGHRLCSVIIPCYNAEDYISECLESLIGQTIGIHNMEVIVIDDASTDRSKEHILKYRERYPENIHLISLNKNAGQSNARNIGMENVSTEYFAFVDADDWVEPDIYEKLLEPANKYRCDLVQCSEAEHICGSESQNSELRIPEELYTIDSVEKRKCFFDKYSLSSMRGTTLYRTAWIKEKGFKFKNFLKYEDNYWGGLIKYAFTTYYPMNEPLYHYRILADSNAHSRNDMRHFERLKVNLEKLRYFQEAGLYDIYYEEIRKDFLESFYSATLHIICCKFDVFPLEQVEMMQSIVKEIFPDYLEYCKSTDRFVNPVLTAAFHFPLEVWNEYKDAYYSWVSEGEQTKIAQFYGKIRGALGIHRDSAGMENV